MKRPDRINIGLFVNSVHNDYTTPMCKGAAIAAEEFDYNLLIVPGREINATWDNIEINQYEYQKNVLYSYITKNNIDVLLISLGTIAIFMSDQEIKEFISRYSNIKIVLMEYEVEGYPCILFSLKGLREAIEHIIIHHNIRKVAFVSGPKGYSIAEKRLDIYKEVLRENDIPYDENYVVYGDFTDYCDEVIIEFLDKIKDNMPEAICCANDSMVCAVKRVCESYGLRVGRDILITGYDDAAFANVMDPPLTTVKSYIMKMGYQAVKFAGECFNNYKVQTRYVDTSLIIRESCGCSADYIISSETANIKSGIPRYELISNIMDYVLKKSSLDIIPKKQIDDLVFFIESVYNNIIIGNGFEKGEVGTLVSKLLSPENIGFFSVDTINAMIFSLKKTALESADYNKKVVVYSCFERIYKSVSIHYAEQSHNVEKRMINERFIFSKMTDDMMANGKDEDVCFKSMMSKIQELGVISCYIFIYYKYFLNEAIEETDSENERHDNIYLKVFYKDGKCFVPAKENQKLKYDNFLNNEYFKDDRQHTTIMQALYYNEEQYGIMLIEKSINDIADTGNISKQMCTSIKLTRFMNLLEGAVENIKKANMVLSRESVSDQLTGVFNRRGFLSESEKLLNSFDGHTTGAVIFADVDNLKTINDTFGHKDGDFAIIKASQILKDNIGKNAILGRIGGDEFVALIINIDNDGAELIRQNIKQSSYDFNISSDKLYNVNLSTGAYFFDTSNGENIDQLMTKADRVLYENKKKKSKTAIKSVIQNSGGNDEQ